jgi:hypothetical protein
MAKASKKSTSSDDFERAVKGEGVDWAPENNIITADLSALYGYLNIHYEKTISRNNGLGFDGYLHSIGGNGWSGSELGVGAEYNWYFQHHALNGWFAGPNASLHLLSASLQYKVSGTQYNSSANAVFIGIGGQGGYRWIWDGGFTVDVKLSLLFLLGGGVSVNDQIAPGSGFYSSPIGVDLGYAW